MTTGLTLTPALTYSTFPDIPEDALYAYAVDTLAEAGIFAGDNRGNFNPYQTMTRAEFAVVTVKLSGEADRMNPNAISNFTDVPTGRWDCGWIAAAVELGTMSGYGGGRFGPSDPVTYEQVVTVLVKMLGHEDAAVMRGGFPYGFMILGDTLGITQNTDYMGSNPVPRSTVAVLIYNAWYGDEDYGWEDWDEDDYVADYDGYDDGYDDD
jgi:hypothetical protein